MKLAKYVATTRECLYVCWKKRKMYGVHQVLEAKKVRLNQFFHWISSLSTANRIEKCEVETKACGNNGMAFNWHEISFDRSFDIIS